MWALIFSSVLLAAAPDAEVRTLRGETAKGTLHSVTEAAVVLESSAGRRDFPASDLLSVTIKADGTAPAGVASVWLDLVDGSRLVGSNYSTTQGKAALTNLSGQAIELPTRVIAAVRFKEQSDKIAAQWADIVAAPRAADVIVVRRDEAIDFQEGIVGDVAAETVQFTLDGDRIDVKRPRVEGLLYFHRGGGELPKAVCQVVGHDGSRWQARQLALTDGRLEVTTPAGAKLVQPIEGLQELDFSLGKLRYLSDLEPQSTEHTPYFGIEGKKLESDRYYQPRMDRSFDGGPLRLETATHEKGIALKSRTRLVYRLPGDFSRFEALAGIDAGVAPLGDVKLTIRGDNAAQPLLEAEIRGGDPPLPLSIDIQGQKRLEIEVDFGGGGDVGDYLNLCEARIIQ
jgi:hypothetical protein